MLKKFNVLIESFFPELEGKNFLLAVSGGVDSMVLFHLFYQSKINFTVAHCNFNLRGKESDDDEQFVKSVCDAHDILFLSKSFATTTLAEQKGISIQMAARELRYDWFQTLMKNKNYSAIVTAHHLSDQIETFLINLIRGTGIEGLCGIPQHEQQVFRPLLGFSKMEILEFAQQEAIQWREDSSNASSDYLRNKLRLEVIPQFEELSGNFSKTMMNNLYRLNEAKLIYRSVIDEKIKSYLEKIEFGFQINLKKLVKEKTPHTILYEILKDFGFNFTSVSNILADHKAAAGQKFYSGTYRAVDHRGMLLLTRLAPNEFEIITIDANCKLLSEPIGLKFEQLSAASVQFDANPKFAYFDLDKLKFPLSLRKWHHGDVFKPFGMKGRKKVSDYFIDQKLSLIDKENCYVLCSADKIIWLVGYRSDERYKVDEKTQSVLKIELLI